MLMFISLKFRRDMLRLKQYRSQLATFGQTVNDGNREYWQCVVTWCECCGHHWMQNRQRAHNQKQVGHDSVLNLPETGLEVTTSFALIRLTARRKRLKPKENKNQFSNIPKINVLIWLTACATQWSRTLPASVIRLLDKIVCHWGFKSLEWHIYRLWRMTAFFISEEKKMANRIGEILNRRKPFPE